MKALIITAVVVALVLLALVVYLGLRNGGIRRRDYNNTTKRLDLALKALDDIETKAAHFQDLESVLATDVRTIIHTCRTERAKIK
jgi:hypothetical protein